MKISVAMCTYNGEKYIREQLESICNQTRKVDEIIISDDCSSDQTLAICEKILSQYKISYMYKVNKPNLGVMKNFQQCFSLCTGDIVFSCDQDDVWEQNKVEKIMNYFELNQDINLIATNATLIDEYGQPLQLTLRESIGFHVNAEQKDFFPYLLKNFCITGATMAFRKNFEESYFYLSDFWLHDAWLSFMAAIDNRFLYLDDKLTRYRLHGNNVCGVGDVAMLKMETESSLKISKKKNLFKTVLKSPYYFEDLAKQKVMMYQEVYDQFIKRGIKNEYNMNDLASCICFWRERSQIKSISFSVCKEMIHRFKHDEAYKKYCESERFSKYDMYFWFLYHVLPRRR